MKNRNFRIQCLLFHCCINNNLYCTQKDILSIQILLL